MSLVPVTLIRCQVYPIRSRQRVPPSLSQVAPSTAESGVGLPPWHSLAIVTLSCPHPISKTLVLCIPNDTHLLHVHFHTEANHTLSDSRQSQGDPFHRHSSLGEHETLDPKTATAVLPTLLLPASVCQHSRRRRACPMTDSVVPVGFVAASSLLLLAIVHGVGILLCRVFRAD